VGGVKVDKNGVGLLKVWKHQLLQLKNISPDIAQAILAVYPSPLMLRQVSHQGNPGRLPQPTDAETGESPRQSWPSTPAH